MLNASDAELLEIPAIEAIAALDAKLYEQIYNALGKTSRENETIQTSLREKAENDEIPDGCGIWTRRRSSRRKFLQQQRGREPCSASVQTLRLPVSTAPIL